MVYDILIKNGMLLTMEKGDPVIQRGGVLISRGRIEYAGRMAGLISVDADLIIDASSKIIMPGLINCHTHLPMSMFRGLADDLPLDVWLNDHIFPAEAQRVNPSSVKKWSLHSCREMLLSGTTTCCDGYFHEGMVAEAVLESGMRAVLGQGVIDFPAPGVSDPKNNVDEAVAFVEKWKERSPLIHPSIFCHSPYTCSKETLTAAKGAASSLGVLLQIHVAETGGEVEMIRNSHGMSVVEYLDSLGLLDEHTLMAHSIWVNERDMDIIAERFAGVAHCPESNMKLASGVAPVPAMLERKIPVGLGTDGCASNNDQDLFSEMDMAAKLHKLINSDPCVMDARTTVAMATIEGAGALGLDGITGSIKKGKRGDIILVDLDRPHMVPLYDPFSALVYAAKGADVSHVFVDGRMVVRDGALLYPESASEFW